MTLPPHISYIADQGPHARSQAKGGVRQASGRVYVVADEHLLVVGVALDPCQGQQGVTDPLGLVLHNNPHESFLVRHLADDRAALKQSKM